MLMLMILVGGVLAFLALGSACGGEDLHEADLEDLMEDLDPFN